MTRLLNRAEILSVVNEHPDLFREALKNRMMVTTASQERYWTPLSFHLILPTNGGWDLAEVPEFRTWFGNTAIGMGLKGAEAFLDVFIHLQSQIIGMQDDQTELLQQNTELFAENRKLRAEVFYLKTDWAPYGWDGDSLPWSRSPQ